MKVFLSGLLIVVSSFQLVYSQPQAVDKVQFFNDTSVLNATIITNMNNIFSKRNKTGYTFPAIFAASLPDGTKVNDQIYLELRGHMRKDYCYIPPIKVIFKNNKSSVMRSLKSLKLVNECKLNNLYDQYLLTRFIIC